MTFPAEMHVDYVRVYQRDGEQNVGCSPKQYPTADYISAHIDAYTGVFCCYSIYLLQTDEDIRPELDDLETGRLHQTEEQLGM